MLIPYTISIFIYITILMVGTITTLLYAIQNREAQSKTILYFKRGLYSFLSYIATCFLYTIMAFGNNQNGVFEAVMLLSDLAYFFFITNWFLALTELTNTAFLKNNKIFIFVSICYALTLEGMVFLSDHFPETFLKPLEPAIKLANFFYLLFLITAGLFYLIISFWMPKSRNRTLSILWSGLFILYPIFELPWMVFIGLVKKTDSDITVRFDLILFLYLAVCLIWLYQKLHTQISAPLEFSKLTQREAEICQLVVKGLSNPEIAKQLFISENTVKHHLNNCFKKLEVKNRYELILRISELSESK